LETRDRNGSGGGISPIKARRGVGLAEMVRDQFSTRVNVLGANKGDETSPRVNSTVKIALGLCGNMNYGTCNLKSGGKSMGRGTMCKGGKGNV